MFKFVGFLFSLLKGIYNACAIHTQVNKQASVARILFAGFFGIFSTSINKILLDAQIKEYNTKLSTTPNTYDESRNDTNCKNHNCKTSTITTRYHWKFQKYRPNKLRDLIIHKAQFNT